MHNHCTMVRRMWVSHGTYSLRSGEHVTHSEGFETRPCAVPLFGVDERARGTCSACHGGYKHPRNHPADEPAPRFEINAARTDHGTRDPDTGQPIVRPRYAVHDGSAYWLDGSRILMAAPLVANPEFPKLLRPDWSAEHEVDTLFPEWEALATAAGPTESEARERIEAWLNKHAPGFPDVSLCSDGGGVWAFWIADHDSTSYLHPNGRVEWYGTGWPDLYRYDGDTGSWSVVG